MLISAGDNKSEKISTVCIQKWYCKEQDWRDEMWMVVKENEV